MNAEQWRAVEQLYHAALALDTEARTAFLDAACPDAALRREVESLLEYSAKAQDFIETPAVHAHPALAAIVATERDRWKTSAPGGLEGRILGAYRVTALIATGGMSEVYRGIDTRLNRVVAIKTLPAHMADDAERRLRLKREAEAVAGLSHPHICTIHDVGIEGHTPYFVMEYIEGETLAQRLTRGPLSIADALACAIQIGDALDRAHRQGIVHRDLKPANIMLTRSGIKVLDFGLALRIPSPATIFEVGKSAIAQGLTAKGTILGTPQYLSPEQLQGRAADARTDIFAFGAVAYEMITGRRAFAAESDAGLISAILKDDPPAIESQVPKLPPRLGPALTRCLAKDPDDRWQTARDLLFQLREIASSDAAVDERSLRRAKTSNWIERAVWSAVVAIAAVAVWLAATSRMASQPESTASAPPVALTLPPPSTATFWSGPAMPMALSPDGRHIVYVAADGNGARRLWLRSLTSEREQPLSGTEEASTPFWSPDSQWVGFFARHGLHKTRIPNGPTQVVATHVATYGGATWGAEDAIVFPASTGGLSRVPVQGGAATPITAGEGSDFWPQFLPDGKRFIYASALPEPRIVLGSLGQEAHRTLMTFPVSISAVAYAAGYVFYVQDHSLFARRLDERTLALSGEPVRLLEGIPVSANGLTPIAVSGAGLLAYWPNALSTPVTLQWFDRDGRSTPVVATPARYVGLSLSPDGRQLVSSRMDGSGGADLWLRDLDRASEAQLTFDRTAYTPRWSPDSGRVLFSGPGQRPPPKLFVKNMGASGAPSRLGPDSVIPDFASSWTPDGSSVVSVHIDPKSGNDLWVRPLDGGTAAPLSINTTSNETQGEVSPDGRWLAYVTDRSGRNEVWLAQFPSGETPVQVSSHGGTSPQWSRNGELFYISSDRYLVAVSVGAGAARPDLRARPLFRVNSLADAGSLLFPTANNYVASPDGQRFLMSIVTPDPAAPPYRIIVNWPAMISRGGS